MNHKERKNIDTYFKSYFHNLDRFSDFFNTLYFHEKAVIDELEEYDSDSSVLLGNDGVVAVERRRDMVKRAHDIILGIEHQSTVDDKMPVRMMEYDSYQYRKQLDNHIKKPLAILSMIVYTGEGKWNEPQTLREMLNINDRYINEHFNDYRCVVYDIKEMKAVEFKNRDNKLMVNAVQKLYSWNGKMEELKELEKLPREVALLVAEMTKMQEVLEYIEKSEGDEINMCTSVELYAKNYYHNGFDKGEKSGFIKGKDEGAYQQMITVCLSLLEQKFGHVSQDIVEKIKRSSIEQLNMIVTQIFSLQDERALEKMLL